MYKPINDNPNLFGCESQNQKILDYLNQGETITSLEALKLFGSMRMPSRAQDLGSKGVQWDTAPRCAVHYVDYEGNLKTKYVSGYFIVEPFAKKYFGSNWKDIPIDDLRKLAKQITETRCNRR